MVNQGKSALELVADITRPRSKLAVERGILECLFKFIPCKGLCLLRMDQRHIENDVISYFPLEVHIPSYFDQHISSVRQVGRPDSMVASDVINLTADLGVYQFESESDTAFFPAVISEWLTDIICIHGIEDPDKNIDFKDISEIITIYANFINVLNEGERDVLTGLLNRKTFDIRLNELLKESYITEHPYLLNKEKREERKAFNENSVSHWIGVLDIDFFKHINDGYGHIYGDEVLLLFSDLMRTVFRNNDLLFRFGGEEFVVFLLNIDQQGAERAFERFRQELERYTFPQVGSVTVSIGLTCMTEGAHTGTLLDQADKALYYAKEHGRNQVCNYLRLREQGLFKEVAFEDNIDLF
jgi:diguanylate cyclase (GGDEF)-like protein